MAGKISGGIYGLLLLGLGCQALQTPAQPNPFAHQLRREQIVLHSDFSLEQHERLVGEMAELRQRLTDQLLLPKTEAPIHVYLFADDVAYYDFLDTRFPGFPHRRAIFVDSQLELAVYAYSGDHVAQDLRHEVTHGYLHAALPHLPLWLDEGLAEYFEVGGSQQGLNTAHLEQLSQLQAFQPNLARLEQLASGAEMTQLDYAESWAWIHFLLESDVDKTAILTDYLADLQQGATTRLSDSLGQRLAHPELSLLEHLAALPRPVAQPGAKPGAPSSAK